MSSWYKETGPNSQMVLSSRIRLARNISNFPFPSRMTGKQFKEISLLVKDAILTSNTPYAQKLKFIEMDNVPENEVLAMVERHIISPEFAENRSGRSIIISGDESICIMVGEEDHLRIQVIKSGLDLQSAYNIADEIDNILSAKINFAFSNSLGYLTECPTNLGTGLRASVMMHLPLLEACGELATISDSVSKVGFTVRGLYGEGTDSYGALYQISNQITLGISEKEALNNLSTITNQIIDEEIAVRKNYSAIKIEDSVFRALGVLKSARILSTSEMMKQLSMIKMGASMGIIPIESSVISTILIEAQPYMLMRRLGNISPDERDIKRADYVREMLN